MKNYLFVQFLKMIVGILFCMSIVSCATHPKLVDHSFSFDAISESPEVTILEYRYGNSKQPGARSTSQGTAQGTGINGAMLQGDELYVKWKMKNTGDIYQDTVDLKKRLPKDITDHAVHFVIKENKLYVYLVSPEKITGACTERMAHPNVKKIASERIFRLYCDRKIFTIYPDPIPPNKFN